MIIRSILRCSGTLATSKHLPKASFYTRFYSVMQAMQAAEDAETYECEQPIAGSSQISLKSLSPEFQALERDIHEPSSQKQSNANLPATRQMAESLFSATEIAKQLQRGSKNSYNAKGRRRRDTSLHTQVDTTPGAAARNDTTKEPLQTTVHASGIIEPVSVHTRDTIDRVVPHRTPRTHSSRNLDSNLQDLFKNPSSNHLGELITLLSDHPETPSVKTFNIIISRLTRLRYNAAAWAIFKTMLRLKYTPNQYTISTVLNLCIVTNSYDDFCKVVKAARLQRSLTKNQRGHRDKQGRSLALFGTLIKGCIKFKKISRAETYLTLMRSEKARPNMEILTLMVQGYTALRDWEAGRPHFQKMLGLPWDRKTVAVLIAYCRACKRPYFEAKVRNLATTKNVVPLHDGDDLARLPANWKTKGLPVSDRFKRPA